MKQNKQDKTHTHTPARSRTNARTWIIVIGFVKNVSYYRCGPLIAAYIDKN